MRMWKAFVNVALLGAVIVCLFCEAAATQNDSVRKLSGNPSFSLLSSYYILIYMSYIRRIRNEQ